VLNGRVDTKSFVESSDIIRFSIPYARLLIVDDIATNLKVAEGLLAPYHAKVDTSLSGIQAIEMVKRNRYDLVFMDHMMPEMDGIEATIAIREWEAESINNEKGRSAVPIIALTANAVVGMKEMFIEKGFSDFLAKPIDISKLDEILDKWIPKEKKGIGTNNKEQRTENNGEVEIRNDTNSPVSDLHSSLLTSHSSFANIPGVDIQHGISMTGGTIELYRQVISLFRKDAEERLPILQNVPDTSTLPGFVTNVHALKSASASIGAAEISAKAAELEAAGKAANMDFIKENLPGFAQSLAELASGIRAWESTVKGEASPSGTSPGEVSPNGDSPNGDDAPNATHGNSLEVIKLLHQLEAALKTERAGDIDRILEELQPSSASQPLSASQMDTETKEALEKISDNVLMTEFGNAAEIVSSLLKRG
jgi:CheY-like chemotaxis protein